MCQDGQQWLAAIAGWQLLLLAAGWCILLLHFQC
jgi:hypothetical protein